MCESKALKVHDPYIFECKHLHIFHLDFTKQ